MTILQYRRYQKRDADLDAVAASGVAAAWTAYTPTVTANTGTFTTLGTRAGRYMIMGKLTLIQVSIAITTNGTAAGFVIATLPNTTGPAVQEIVGGETALTGKILRGGLNASGGVMWIVFADGTYPGASGATLVLSGSYENA